MIEKAMSFLFPDGIVPWCNGNTSDFGSDISSSSLDGITKRKRLSNEFRQPLFGFVLQIFIRPANQLPWLDWHSLPAQTFLS